MRMHAFPRVIDRRPDRRHGVILVIDECLDTVAELAPLFNTAGYNCHCCPHIDAAIEQMRIVWPDLVIADLQCVGSEGRLFSERARAEFGFGDLPQMFLSAQQGPDVIRRSGLHGGSYYLRKPLDTYVLLELVDNALWGSTAALTV